MTTNKPKTVWWVEPNHMPGVHRIRSSVRHLTGHTIEVSYLVPQELLDSAIVPHLFVGQIIANMQYDLNEVIRESVKPR